jgi:hypothetical protein
LAQFYISNKKFLVCKSANAGPGPALAHYICVMNSFRSFHLLAIGLACMSCLAQSPPVAGRWRSLVTSNGGIGAIFDFHTNGTLDFSPGAVVESKYRIEGNELISPPATLQGPEIRQTIEWTGDDILRLLAGKDATTELTRQGPRSNSANPILGEWTGKREISGQSLTTRWFFYPGGKSLFLLPFTTIHGQYSTTGTSMRLELPNCPAVEGQFRLDGDVLSIPGLDGNTERYARF